MFSCGGSMLAEASSLERRSARKSEQINLLCYKRSFNVSIFIKQFKEGAAQVVNYIREGRGDLIGLERLNSLVAILPDSEEIEILRGFTGDVTQLGPAEQFFLNLLIVTDYKLKLECLILKLELESAFDTLLPQINVIITASNEIKSSTSLPKVFCMLVQIGNFLNANASCGNAAGFKLNSLWKIVDMKATKKSITLLHFIAMQDVECADSLSEELKTVPSAAKLSLEGIRTEVRTLSDKLTRIGGQIKAKTSDPYFDGLSAHFEEAQEKMTELEKKLEQLGSLIAYLAFYFCEEEKTFKLEECFKILSTFVCRLHDALRDNEERRKRERRSELRALNAQSNLQHSSSNLDLSNNKLLVNVLEHDGALDRHIRTRSQSSAVGSTPNINIEGDDSSSENEMRRTRRTVRSSRNLLKPDEESEKMPSIVRLRRQSRHKSDAFLIRHSQNLDDFLVAAEQVEKEAIRGSSERHSSVFDANNEPLQEVLIDIPGTLPAASGSVSSVGSSPSARTAHDEGFESDKSERKSTEHISTRAPVTSSSIPAAAPPLVRVTADNDSEQHPSSSTVAASKPPDSGSGPTLLKMRTAIGDICAQENEQKPKVATAKRHSNMPRASSAAPQLRKDPGRNRNMQSHATAPKSPVNSNGSVPAQQRISPSSKLQSTIKSSPKTNGTSPGHSTRLSSQDLSSPRHTPAERNKTRLSSSVQPNHRKASSGCETPTGASSSQSKQPSRRSMSSLPKPRVTAPGVPPPNNATPKRQLLNSVSNLNTQRNAVRSNKNSPPQSSNSSPRPSLVSKNATRSSTSASRASSAALRDGRSLMTPISGRSPTMISIVRKAARSSSAVTKEVRPQTTSKVGCPTDTAGQVFAHPPAARARALIVAAHPSAANAHSIASLPHPPAAHARSPPVPSGPATSRPPAHPKSASGSSPRTAKKPPKTPPQPNGTSSGNGAEKQKLAMKRSDSCSTASRPALIKTGSVTKPGWR
ncbi:unnamed protein product [Toxocara canis]|uniref:FH2 domain-containing protein n=1 Tax=Toxocara canis TaxID=6265 RepID=A0A183V6R1_TOXCA|nr:unnamed protein product [Toxocara canis]